MTLTDFEKWENDAADLTTGQAADVAAVRLHRLSEEGKTARLHAFDNDLFFNAGVGFWLERFNAAGLLFTLAQGTPWGKGPEGLDPEQSAGAYCDLLETVFEEGSDPYRAYDVYERDYVRSRRDEMQSAVLARKEESAPDVRHVGEIAEIYRAVMTAKRTGWAEVTTGPRGGWLLIVKPGTSQAWACGYGFAPRRFPFAPEFLSDVETVAKKYRLR